MSVHIKYIKNIVVIFNHFTLRKSIKELKGKRLLSVKKYEKRNIIKEVEPKKMT